MVAGEMPFDRLRAERKYVDRHCMGPFALSLSKRAHEPSKSDAQDPLTPPDAA
jgi:hypothetical protein